MLAVPNHVQCALQISDHGSDNMQILQLIADTHPMSLVSTFLFESVSSVSNSFPHPKHTLPVAFSPFTENSRGSLTSAGGHKPCPEVSLIPRVTCKPLFPEQISPSLVEKCSLTLPMLFFNSQFFPATCD